MHCNKITELLDLYIDGELDEEALDRVERHLLRCNECSFQVRSLEQTRTLLRKALPVSESSPSFRERTSARLQEEFADVLQTQPAQVDRQWALPFLRETA
jgi:anti-sigma factor RsiW